MATENRQDLLDTDPAAFARLLLASLGLPAEPLRPAAPRLKERLEVYETLWQLVQLLHFPPGAGPLGPWGALRALLTSDNNWARF